MKKIVAALFVLAFMFVACEPGVLNPPSGPGTEYPCGLQGKVCGNNKCCWRADNCGGEAGCPAGYCCFDTNKDFEFGTKQPYPQMSKDEAKARSAPR